MTWQPLNFNPYFRSFRRLALSFATLTRHMPLQLLPLRFLSPNSQHPVATNLLDIFLQGIWEEGEQIDLQSFMPSIDRPADPASFVEDDSEIDIVETIEEQPEPVASPKGPNDDAFQFSNVWWSKETDGKNSPEIVEVQSKPVANPIDPDDDGYDPYVIADDREDAFEYKTQSPAGLRKADILNEESDLAIADAQPDTEFQEDPYEIAHGLVKTQSRADLRKADILNEESDLAIVDTQPETEFLEVDSFIEEVDLTKVNTQPGAELLEVSGFGNTSLEKFGEELLKFSQLDEENFLEDLMPIVDNKDYLENDEPAVIVSAMSTPRRLDNDEMEVDGSFGLDVTSPSAITQARRVLSRMEEQSKSEDTTRNAIAQLQRQGDSGAAHEEETSAKDTTSPEKAKVVRYEDDMGQTTAMETDPKGQKYFEVVSPEASANHIAGSVIPNIRKVYNSDGEYRMRKLRYEESLVVGDDMYWAAETVDWPHRERLFIWIQGPIPVGLPLKSTPMVMDWESTMDSKDRETWPPTNALLSDLVIAKVFMAGISLRDRHGEWPFVFQTAGHIITDRPNMGPAANEKSGGAIKDLLFRKDYILHGDLGAARAKEHFDNPARVGVKSETYEDPNTHKKHIFTVLFDPVSRYPFTRSEARFLPELMGVAIRLDKQIARAPEATTIPVPAPPLKAPTTLSSRPIDPSTPRKSNESERPTQSTIQTRSKADAAPVATPPALPIRVAMPKTPNSAIEKMQMLHKKASPSSVSPAPANASSAQKVRALHAKTNVSPNQSKAEDKLNVMLEAMIFCSARSAEFNTIITNKLVAMGREAFQLVDITTDENGITHEKKNTAFYKAKNQILVDALREQAKTIT